MVKRFKRAINRGGSFRQQAALAEQRRGEILARLECVPDSKKDHPAFANIRTLLGSRYAKSSIAQRLAVIQSAEWLLNILEALPFI